jgi:hypothetical protein
LSHGCVGRARLLCSSTGRPAQSLARQQPGRTTATCNVACSGALAGCPYRSSCHGRRMQPCGRRRQRNSHQHARPEGTSSLFACSCAHTGLLGRNTWALDLVRGCWEGGKSVVQARCLGGILVPVARDPLVFRLYSACVPLILSLFPSGAFRNAAAALPRPSVSMKAQVSPPFRLNWILMRTSCGLFFQTLSRHPSAFRLLPSALCFLHCRANLVALR